MAEGIWGAAFHAGNRALCEGFDWAARQARAYVRLDAPIGPCYEASLPRREAFCMRDTAHQALGAHVLGLADANRNMMNHFARAITDARDFCSLWEIRFDGTPCPADYVDDCDFWYNLPANFDVMDACMRLYDWTGDVGYLLDPQMETFHRISTDEYVRRWDRDKDGIPDRLLEDGRRGIASYDESRRNRGYRVAADLLAAQYAAYTARARMLRLRGEQVAAAGMEAEAERLRTLFRDRWWLPEEERYASVRYGEDDYGGEYIGMDAFLPLFFGLIGEKSRRGRQIAYILAHDAEHNQEERSYLPEILWRYGADEAAQVIWLRMVDKKYARREYPEVSFAALGAIASGYMGIAPDATRRAIATRSAVPDADGWAQINYLPLWGGYIHLTHESGRASTLENHTGADLTWRPAFEGGDAPARTVAAGETARAVL